MRAQARTPPRGWGFAPLAPRSRPTGRPLTPDPQQPQMRDEVRIDRAVWSRDVSIASSRKALVGNSPELSIRAAQAAPAAGGQHLPFTPLPMRSARTKIPPELLDLARAVPLASALQAIEYHVRVDETYRPQADPRSQRWLIDGPCGVHELVVTDRRWFDLRAQRGGFGALDLVMHITGLPLPKAVRIVLPAPAADHG